MTMVGDSEQRKRKFEEVDPTTNGEASMMVSANTAPQKKIRFRNYEPHDKKLLEKYGTKAQTVPEGEFVLGGIAVDIITEELHNVQKQQEEENGGKVDFNIAPKKINFDLKKQIQPKLDKLKRRTQRAIVELLREKLALEDSDSD